MEYRLYTTPAIVLARRPAGEANSVLWLLTRDYGLIIASAQRSRDISSKLRFSLQIFSYLTVSLVRGRYGWRITNAIPLRYYFSRIKTNTDQLTAVAGIALSIRRLVAGEEPDSKLYRIFLEALNFFSASSGRIRINQTQAAERIAMLRILHRLGYIAEDDPQIRNIIETVGFSDGILSQASVNQPNLTVSINNALEVSHLSFSGLSDRRQYNSQ